MWLVRDMNSNIIWRNDTQKEAFGLDRNYDLWRNAVAHALPNDVHIWEDAHSKALKTRTHVTFTVYSRPSPDKPTLFSVVCAADICDGCENHCAAIIQHAVFCRFPATLDRQEPGATR